MDWKKFLGFKKEPAETKEMSSYPNQPNTFYRASGTDRLRSDWITSVMSDTTPPTYELTNLRVRSRDLVRNDPVAHALVDTFLTSVIGAGLDVQSTISATALGVSEEKASKIREACEAAFERWSRYADKANVMNFNEIQRLVFNKIIIDGEAIVLPTWNDSKFRPYGRCISMVESEELDYNYVPNDRTVNGISFDSFGSPTMYWLRKYTKSQWGGKVAAKQPPTPIRARDDKGRPNVLHVFETLRPNQTRGVPKLAPILDKFEELNEYVEAELVSARISACLSIFVTKNDPIAAAQAMATGTEDWSGDRIEDIEPGLVNYLAPGESIAVVDPKRSEGFGTFIESVLRLVGMSMGMPYELLVKDFSKTNYSSARAALLEARRQFTHYRRWFAEKFCQPIYELVLEEAYYRGEIPITTNQFETKFDLIKRADWIGAPWGLIDEKAETEAAMMRINAGLSTYATELSAQGKEWEEVFAQRKAEQDMIESLEIPVFYDLKGHDAYITAEETAEMAAKTAEKISKQQPKTNPAGGNGDADSE